MIFKIYLKGSFAHLFYCITNTTLRLEFLKKTDTLDCISLVYTYGDP